MKNKKEKKLHEIYQEKFKDSSLSITKGYQLQSNDYQLRLAKLVLEEAKEKELKCSGNTRKIFINSKTTVLYCGDKTDEEIIDLYRNLKKHNDKIKRKRPVGRRKKIDIENEQKFLNDE